MEFACLKDYRCGECDKLLFKGICFDCKVEIKCRRCGKINKIDTIKLTDEPNQYLLIVDDNGQIINASESACRILKFNDREISGKFLADIDRTITEEMNRRFFGKESVLNKENFFQLETFHQAKDGTIIPVIVHLKLYQPAGSEHYLLVWAEFKAREVENKFSVENALEFPDNACDFHFSLDKNGLVQSVSQSVEKLLGFKQALIIGKKYFDLLPAPSSEQSRKAFEKFSVTAQPYRLVHDGGIGLLIKKLENELYFTPTFDEYWKFSGYRVLGWSKSN
jgi:PAS domain S-box-containing protein